MYLPLLRGKSFEMFALRDLARYISESESILPIIEPVKQTPSIGYSFDHFVNEGMKFILLVNPIVGNYTNSPSQLRNEIINSHLDEYDNYIPAFYLTNNITRQNIDEFIEEFEDYNLAFLFNDELNDDQLNEYIRNLSNVEFFIFQRQKVSSSYTDQFIPEKSVKLQDNFIRQSRNSDFPETDLFSDLHLNIPNSKYIGFGDYSIVGNYYYERGGPAHAVALHHVYLDNNQQNKLFIKHFLSDRTETPADVAGKFNEALQKLINYLPSLGIFNRTYTCEEYTRLYTTEHFPGLGQAKRLAIKHHIELMMKYYGYFF